MQLTEAHFELLDALIDDMEPFDGILRIVQSPLGPDEALHLLLELEQMGLVESAVHVELTTWRKPRPADYERALSEEEGLATRPAQSNLWFQLTAAGQAAYREIYGEREATQMWRTVERDDLLEVNAVSQDVAEAVIAQWQQRNPEIVLERIGTRTPAPFTLADGTVVEPGVLITFRRRRVDVRPLS